MPEERKDDQETLKEETEKPEPQGEPEKPEEKTTGEARDESAMEGSPGNSAGSPGPGEHEKEREAEEEFRRLVEESLEKVTVADIVLSMMNQLASMAYLRLGLPESVNLKYRDFAQARLAIDMLDAMIKAGEGKMEPESLKPFRGTLANLQMNFVQLVKVKKG